MKTRFTIAGATLLAMLASLLVVAMQPADAAVGLRVSGARIVEANGSNFVMRGVSHAHVWYPTQTSSFAAIKATGANTVRVVLGSGQRWGPTGAAEVTTVVNLCKQNRLICVLEAHDTTGFGEEGAAASLDQAVSYWISVRSALVGQENYVVLNIGNEPYGNNNTTAWTAATRNAITRLRSADFDHLIMVDAPNWGQDWQFVMRDNAASVFAADPDRNTVFSVHMYGVFDTAAEVTDYMARFQAAGLPLVVGEFGFDHSDGDPDEDTIMAQAQSRGIGYIGWSWSGNSGGVEYLDMVTGFNPSSPTPWGTRIVNGANGIRATSREASVYGGPIVTTTPGGPTTTPPRTTTPAGTTPAVTTPAGTTSVPVGTRSCTATYTINPNQWSGGFQAEVRVTAGGAAITGWTLTWTFPSGQSIASSWNAQVTPSGQNITARNMSYNGTLAAGASATWGFIGSSTGTASPVPVTCTAS